MRLVSDTIQSQLNSAGNIQEENRQDGMEHGQNKCPFSMLHTYVHMYICMYVCTLLLCLRPYGDLQGWPSLQPSSI